MPKIQTRLHFFIQKGIQEFKDELDQQGMRMCPECSGHGHTLMFTDVVQDDGDMEETSIDLPCSFCGNTGAVKK